MSDHGTLFEEKNKNRANRIYRMQFHPGTYAWFCDESQSHQVNSNISRNQLFRCDDQCHLRREQVEQTPSDTRCAWHATHIVLSCGNSYHITEWALIAQLTSHRMVLMTSAVEGFGNVQLACQVTMGVVMVHFVKIRKLQNFTSAWKSSTERLSRHATLNTDIESGRQFKVYCAHHVDHSQDILGEKSLVVAMALQRAVVNKHGHLDVMAAVASRCWSRLLRIIEMLKTNIHPPCTWCESLACCHLVSWVLCQDRARNVCTPTKVKN